MTLRRPPLTELIAHGTDWNGRWGRLDTTPPSARVANESLHGAAVDPPTGNDA